MRRLPVSALLLLCTIAGGRAGEPSEPRPLWLREPALSPDASRIAFRYHGRIWTVPATGGEARALTGAGAHAETPVWAPDGQNLAFASDRSGALNLYGVPAAGGEARRLTWYSLDERPMSMTPDGRSVLFASARLGDATRTFAPPLRSELASQVYAVPLAGGRETLVLPNAALDATWDPEGRRLLYTSANIEQRFRQHQVSQAVRQVWLYDAATGRHERLTGGTRESRGAVWLPGGEIAYLGEASGTLNVWRLSLADRVPRQVTRFDGAPVRSLSASRTGDLAFARDGQVYRLRAGGGTPEPVPITAPEATFPDAVPARTSDFGDLAPAPLGHEVALVAQGEIYVAARDGKSVKRITRTPGEERNPAFSPDGRRLAYAAERDGHWGLYEVRPAQADERGFAQATRLIERALPTPPGDAFLPTWSPDGRQLAYIHDRGAVHVLDPATGADREVVPPGRFYPYRDGSWWLAWSPDGRWLALPVQLDRGFTDNVAVVPADGSRPAERVAPAGEGQGEARWSPDGGMLVWRSEPEDLHSASGATEPADIDAVFASRRARDAYEARLRVPIEPEASRPADRGTEPGGEPDTAEAKAALERAAARPAPQPFDPDGLEDRRHRLSPGHVDVVLAAMLRDGTSLLVVERSERPKGEGYALTGTIRDLRRGTRRTVFSDLSYKAFTPVRLSRDQKSLLVLSGTGFTEVDLAKGTPRHVRVEADASHDPAARLAAGFDQYWRLTRAKFLDPGMHGVDWDAVRTRYARFLPALADARDLAELLSEMAGELDASHTRAFLSPSVPAGEETASLGLYYDETFAGPGMRVAAILPAGPFDTGDTRLAPGDVITAVDGEAVPDDGGPRRLLRGTRDRRIEVAFVKPDGTELRERRVPVSLERERDLAFERWRRRRRDAVAARSCGRLGYVHVRAMNAASYRSTFAEVFGRFGRAEGLVVDVRFNGGGNLHNQLLTMLSGRPYLTFAPRTGPVQSDPRDRWSRPSAVLMNGASYSDASIFPQGYRDLGIGPLVGEPVAGTGTFVWWVPSPIVPRLTYGLPQVPLYRTDGTRLENTDVLPDLAVPADPAAWAEGRDPQLDAAVDRLLGGTGGACRPVGAAVAPE
ncbi:tricorn protease [Methylobacterium sp. ap11]|uniref:S41 family peptidase n=1 Tax=Methylobacterium sp. ap11 TaxID=1761799 RepID=UPI0008B97C4F|nr:S41 family peptidase [Methylobacterium sp. ap11]SEP44996.1 tricorn protease [Methylobacterium sp. ap11]